MNANKKHGVVQRIAATLGAGALVIAGAVALGGPAFAAEPYDLPTGTGSITLHKFEQPTPAGGANDNGQPITVPGEWVALNDVKFDVQPIANVDLTTDAGWTTVADYAAAPSTIPAGDLGSASEIITSGSGTSAGQATASGLPIGAYLVTETDYSGATLDGGEAANVFSGSAPFVVSVPTPQGDGTWLMNVNAYPKNSVTEVSKTVSAPTGVGIGEKVTWTVTSTIPSLKSGESFTGFEFTDVLDAKLTYIPSSAAVTATPDGGGAAVVAAFTDNTSGQNVAIDLTAAGLTTIHGNQGGTATLTFDTTVTASGAIVNQANVYLNDPGHTDPATTSLAATYWGQVSILKHVNDDAAKTLAGAVFSVYASEADATAGTDAIDVDGETTFTTASNGIVLIPGLYVGNDALASTNYWLREITSPSGYQPITTAIGPVVVTAGGVATAVEVAVPNVQRPSFSLPLTGGEGALALTIIGGALLAIALGFAIVALRRRSARNKGQ